MNEQNLISLADRPEHERKEIAAKGGAAAAESKREKKKLRQELEILLHRSHEQSFADFTETAD